jgi:diguanylate cyclase
MELLNAIRQEDPVATRAELRLLFTRIETNYLDYPEKTIKQLQSALRTAEQLGDQALLATAERHYARILVDLGQDKEALQMANAALHRFENLYDDVGAGYVLLTIALAHTNGGDFANALNLLERAQNIALKQGDEELEMRACGNLNLLYIDLQRYEQAKTLLERTLQLAQKLGMPHIELRVMSNLGYVLLMQARTDREIGHLESAQSKLHRARECLNTLLHDPRQQDSQVDLALTHLHLANVYHDLDDLPCASHHLEHTEAIVSQSSPPSAFIQSKAITWAQLHSRYGRHAQAIQTLQALIAGEHGEIRANCALPAWKALAEIAEQAGDFVLALQALKEHHRLNLALLNERVTTEANVLTLKMKTERAQIEAETLRMHAQQLARHNSRLADEASMLTRQAHEDGLTNLSNRRFFDEQFPKLLQDPALQQSLFIAIADLDHFKQINDQFSHAMGDEVLRQVSATLRIHSRAGDLVARYGGEEFVLVLPYVNAAQALAACQRLRSAVENHNWQALASDLRVTMSIGLVQCNPLLSALANIEAADKMLYQAKHHGRNRVCM